MLTSKFVNDDYKHTDRDLISRSSERSSDLCGRMLKEKPIARGPDRGLSKRNEYGTGCFGA